MMTCKPYIHHQDGTRSKPAPLSFTRMVECAKGKFIRYTYFDVPEQAYADGYATGLKCAAELMNELSTGNAQSIMLSRIITAAVAATSDDFGVSRNGAATSFLQVVGAAMEFFAHNSDHHARINTLIVQAQDYDKYAARAASQTTAPLGAGTPAGKAAKHGGAGCARTRRRAR